MGDNGGGGWRWVVDCFASLESVRHHYHISPSHSKLPRNALADPLAMDGIYSCTLLFMFNFNDCV